MSNDNTTQRFVEVNAGALPLFCPTPSVSLWNAHPRVAIPVEIWARRAAHTAARCTNSRANCRMGIINT